MTAPTARSLQLLTLTRSITALALAHPHDLPTQVARLLSPDPIDAADSSPPRPPAARRPVGLRRARQLVTELVAHQWLVADGTPRRRSHRPGLLRQVVRSYPLAGLQEDLPWARDFAPCFAVAPNVGRLAQYAFTELLNNAVDHSGGDRVTVSMRQTASHLQLLVSDDGCGVFDHVGRATGALDPACAAFDVAKGKATSAPLAHAGRGLFFSARVADVFELHANAVVFQHRAGDASRPLRSTPARGGSSVFVGIALDTQRSLDAVLRQWSTDGAGYGFDRTVVPLRLLAAPTAGLESRAQGRRAAHRLQEFGRVDLDFAGLDDIGHGFADELLRVWRRGAPQIDLRLLNMAPRVAAMVASIGTETPTATA